MKKLIIALSLLIYSVPSLISASIHIKTNNGHVCEFTGKKEQSLLKCKTIKNYVEAGGQPILDSLDISKATLEHIISGISLLEQNEIGHIDTVLHSYEVNELFDVIQALSLLDMPALLNLACKAWSNNYELTSFENNKYIFENPIILEKLEMLRLIKSHLLLETDCPKVKIIEQRAHAFPLAYSPDRVKLASGSYGHNAYVFDLQTGKDMFALPHLGKVKSICFSPDGSTIASCADHYAYLWDAETGQCLYQFNKHVDPVFSVCFNHDGTLLASASGDTTIALWDTQTGECVQMFFGHHDAVRSLCFSQDGTKLASGSNDNTIRIWDIVTGRCLHVLSGHQSRINTINFSHDGILLASGSTDCSVRIWDVSAEKSVAVLEGHKDAVYSVSFSPDSLTLCSMSKDDTSRIWDIAEPIKNELSYHQLLFYTLIAYSSDPVDLRNKPKSEAKRS